MPLMARNESRTARILPFLNWLAELRNAATLRADIVAGITVALVLVPQSMAYAQLAGLPAYYGLYAAFLPPIVAALFGSSRQLATGPVAVVSLLTATALEPIVASGSQGYVAYAILLSLLVGLFQLSLGLLRLGVLVNFLSHPVVIGFTNAAAIIIATSQLDKIFGVRVEKAEHHYETIWNTITAAIVHIHWPTLVMATAAFAIMITLRRFYPRVPNVLVAVTVTTVAAWLLGFERLQTIPVERIESTAVQEVVADQQKLKHEIPALDREIKTAQRRFDDAVSKHGVNDSRTLAALHAFDSLKLRRERRISGARTDVEELKKVRFDFVPGVDGALGTFYLLGDAPEEAVTDGRTWRVRSLSDDGQLVMNGGGNVVGAVPGGLPSFSLPHFDFAVALQLLTAALTISLIGFMEAISIAKAMATKTRQKLDANQELIGQGIGNIVGSLTQSYPTSGSFSRSAVNINAGAVTGFSSVVTGIIVVVALLWLTPLLYHLPQATLAAVIMMAVVGLINFKAVTHAWQAHPHDGIVAVVSFVLTLALAPHLDKGIMVGAGLALALYLYRTMQPRVAVLARHPDGTLRDAEVFGLETCKEISMIRFDGSLYFANTSYFEDKIQERVALKPGLRFVIVAGDGINNIDATGEEMLAHLAERLDKAGIALLFTGLKKQVLDVLLRTGLYDKIGAGHFFRTEELALDHAWRMLGNNHEANCPLNIVCPVPAAKVQGGNPADTGN
jgi:MFS superfamily sulfate permease-like transporter